MVAVSIVMFYKKTLTIQKEMFGILIRQESADLLDHLYNQITAQK